MINVLYLFMVSRRKSFNCSLTHYCHVKRCTRTSTNFTNLAKQANQTVHSVYTKRLKRTPPQNSPKATKATKSERAAKVTNVWPPPNYWKPPANHNPGLTWGDHPEGGDGNGIIMDGASDKKANTITWLTNTTGFTHYDNYIDMYIAQQVRVRVFVRLTPISARSKRRR
jgi:hypothetical protein